MGKIVVFGHEVLFDDADEALIANRRWHLKEYANVKYAARSGFDPKTKKTACIRMHREILGLTDRKVLVDHINGNGLDNRRCNLRIATKSLNGLNCGKRRNNKSGYKGVFRHTSGRWATMIRIKNKSVHIGYFDTAEEASAAYRAKVREIYPEANRAYEAATTAGK